MDKCMKITFRGSDRSFNILNQKLDHSRIVKDLGIHVSDNLTWEIHIEERLRKANKVLYLLRRNVAVKVQTLIKLGLYKSLILPVLLYGFACLCIKSRSPATRKIPEEGSEMDNREKDNELSKPTENPAATNVSNS